MGFWTHASHAALIAALLPLPLQRFTIFFDDSVPTSLAKLMNRPDRLISVCLSLHPLWLILTAIYYFYPTSDDCAAFKKCGVYAINEKGRKLVFAVLIAMYIIAVAASVAVVRR